MLNNILSQFGKKDKHMEQLISNPIFKPDARTHAPKITAIWGNPSSGKTVTAMKLAKELAANKKNVIVIFADIFCPVISTVMPTCDTKNRTLGSLLSKPTIKQSDIMEKTIPYLNPPVYDVFKSFLAQTNLINGNLSLALENIKYKIASEIFRE